jgi:SNF2 family DNA or RNA helicase
MTQREVPAIDTLVIDESTKFKNIRARRTRYLLAVMEAFERRYILTGFPAPNGYLDLYAQIYVLDQGEALGINFTQFQRTYFWMERVGNYTRAKLRPQAANKINQRIAPLISQLTVEDVMVLPKLFHVPRYVHPPESFLRDYQKLEKELIVMIDNEPTAFQLSTATALIKCRQYVNGFVYADEKTHILNDYKITALKELVEQLGQKPVLIFYSFTADGKRIMAELDVPRKAQIHGGMKQSDKVPIFEKWNQGALDALVCHPSTMAHGANIQQGGHVMIWYSLLFDYELYYQGCRRLWRSGQEHQTYSYYLLMPGTVDMDIYHAIRGKKHRIYKDFIKFFKERINTSLRLN